MKLNNYRYDFLSLLLLLNVVVPSFSIAKVPADIINIASLPTKPQFTHSSPDFTDLSQLCYENQEKLLSLVKEVSELRGYIEELQRDIEQIKAALTTRKDRTVGTLQVPASKEKNGDFTGKTLATKKLSEENNNEKKDYEIAFSLASQETMLSEAISAFNNFLQKYPASDYKTNTYYWLGNLYHNKGEDKIALQHYAKVINNTEESPKRAEAMFQVGLIMQKSKQNNNAKKIYQQIIKQYPTTSSAKKAKNKLNAL